MPFFSTTLHARPRPFLRWMAAGCALLVVVLGLFAASPQLHELIHHDANHVDHECAVTIFHHGVEDTGAALPQLIVIWRVVGDAAATPAVFLLTEARGLLPPSCGPPTA